jgi:hypothetical protein
VLAGKLANLLFPENEICGSYWDVGSAGGIAGYVLTLSKSLVHRDSDDASGYPDVEVLPSLIVVSL